MPANTKRSTAVPPRRLLYLAKRWYSATKARLDEITRRQDLTAGDYSILSFLKRLEPCSAADLARALRITPQATTQQVAQLKAKGLVTSQEKASNRRISLITSTELGRTSFAAVSAEARLFEEAMMAGLTPEQREMILAFLVRSTEIAESRGPIG